MASFSSACVLSILVLVAILHASSAYPTSVDDDNMVYAEWLKQEDSRSMSRSNEANQGSQISIRASRRSGAGSGSGSGSGTPPPPPPPPPPSTPTPTAAATTVAASTVVATSPTV